MTEQQSKPWHLDKSVPITLIIGLIGQALIGAWFVSKFDSRLAELEKAQIAQHERDVMQDKAVSEAIGLLRGDIRDLGQKLDRLVERGLIRPPNR